MKKIRIGLTIFMFLFAGLAWVAQVNGRVKAQERYRQAVEEAGQLLEAGLFQRALLSLEEALAIREEADIRLLWRDACGAAYAGGVVPKNQYVSAMETVTGLQPDNVENWERLIGFCLENEEYKSAYSYCAQAEDARVSSAMLDEYQRQTRYSLLIRGRVYLQAYSGPEGYSAVTDGIRWGILDPEGEWAVDLAYDFIGPVSGELVKLTGVESEYRVTDKKSMVLSVLDGKPDAARAAREGLLPLQRDGSWQYYDLETSEFIPESYEEAASFAGGVAAVKEDGSWRLIDRSGNQVGASAFQDVKLYGNGEYLYDGFFVAREGGSYGLYNRKGEKAADISGRDMDVYLGEGVAYQGENGMWGYMDKKGRILIEPQFEDARSFSHGLAGVCVDGQWGFINSAGKIVIDCQYLDVGYFTPGGVCLVSELAGEYYMICLRFPDGK